MDPIIKRLMENHAVDTEDETVDTPTEEEVVESDEVDTEELDEAIPSEFRESLKEISTDLQNVIIACNGFDEGFATKELKRIHQLCSEAMKVLKMIK